MDRKHPGSVPKNAADVNFGDEDKETITEVMERFLAASIPPGTEAVPEGTSQAAKDIVAERVRQISKEDWSTDHDDDHAFGELAKAGACYASTAFSEKKRKPAAWPWDVEFWKPKVPRRNLIRAAALILAEIEKLDRDTQSI